MKSVITRFALIASTAVAAGGLMMAGTASAQSTPTIQLVGKAGAEVATLSGTVDTGSIVNNAPSDGTPC